ERVHRAHGDVVFIGVDEDERADVAAKVVQSYGLTFPVVHDRENALSGRFRVTAMPMTFVVDRAGVIRWVGDETPTEESLACAVRGPRGFGIGMPKSVRTWTASAPNVVRTYALIAFRVARPFERAALAATTCCRYCARLSSTALKASISAWSAAVSAAGVYE